MQLFFVFVVRLSHFFSCLQQKQVICSDSGRGQGSFPSWGRRRRSINKTEASLNDQKEPEQDILQAEEDHPLLAKEAPSGDRRENEDSSVLTEKEPPEEVHELLRVYSSRSQIPKDEALSGTTVLEEDDLDEPLINSIVSDRKSSKSLSDQRGQIAHRTASAAVTSHVGSETQLHSQPLLGAVCVSATHYYSLLTGLLLFLLLFLLMLSSFTLVFRQGARRKLGSIESPESLTRCSSAGSSTRLQRSGPFRLGGDESLYLSAPAQSEKARSLRSLTVEQLT